MFTILASTEVSAFSEFEIEILSNTQHAKKRDIVKASLSTDVNNMLRQEGSVASQPYVLGRFSRKTGRFLQLSKKHIQEFSKSIYVLDTT